MLQLLGKDIISYMVKTIPLCKITEVRLRINQPIAIKDDRNNYFIDIITSKDIINKVLSVATDYSVYAKDEEIKHAFISYRNGIRIGVLGDFVIENQKIVTQKNINYVNIRIPHELKGVSSPLHGILNKFENTIIISPPFCGKTTLLRDFTRELANFYDIAVIDERNELSGYDGVNYFFDLGRRADISVSTPKALIYESIIRVFSPEIIVCDELSPSNDLEFLTNAERSGVKILATLHCQDTAEFLSKYKELSNKFRYMVTLGNKPHIGCIQSFIRYD